MFWDKGYAQSKNIEALLQKEDLTLEELLDDEDILQECKNQKRNLVNFLTRPHIIKRLVELITTEPPENVSMAERFKHPNMACEILTCGLQSLDEKLVEEPTILQNLYSFLEQEPPLNPLLSSFFSKTFCMLISRKPETDWFLYQKMCLQMLEFIKSREHFLELIIKHFATPVIADLLAQIIKEVQGAALKKSLYEWLTEEKLVERLINTLGNPDESEKFSNVAEFICDLIKTGRSMRQMEPDNSSFETTFVGSDPLLQYIESEEALTLLLQAILKDPISEKSLVSGVSIILTLVDKSIVDEPASEQALQMMIDKEEGNHERIVATVIKAIVPRIMDFQTILNNPPTKTQYTSSNTSSPPFGYTRLQICCLFTVLLRTGTEDITNAICETDYFNILLKLFKHYCWNNFLHSEVDKCFNYVFATFNRNDNEEDTHANPSALQTHVIVKCNIISKLIDCWMHNNEVQSFLKGRRLGYMGHLINIIEYVSICISKSEKIGALIIENLSEEEQEAWKKISGDELSTALATQSRHLADINPALIVGEPNLLSNDTLVYYNDPNDMADALTDSDILFTNQQPLSYMFKYLNEDYDPVDPPDFTMDFEEKLKIWGNNLGNGQDDDENMGYDTFVDAKKSSDSSVLNFTDNLWGAADPFSNMSTTNAAGSSGIGGWADFSSSNFAEFDAHFNSFNSDLSPDLCKIDDAIQPDSPLVVGKSDRNANVEKSLTENCDQIAEMNLKNVKNSEMITEIDNEIAKRAEIIQTDKKDTENMLTEQFGDESDDDKRSELKILSNGPNNTNSVEPPASEDDEILAVDKSSTNPIADDVAENIEIEKLSDEISDEKTSESHNEIPESSTPDNTEEAT